MQWLYALQLMCLSPRHSKSVPISSVDLKKMLIPLTSPQQLHQAKKYFDHYLPQSSIISQWLKINLDQPGGFGTTEKISCFVDLWPEPEFIVGIDFFESYDHENYPKFVFFTKSTEDNEKIENFLIDLSREIKIDQIGGFEAKAIDTKLQSIFDRMFINRLNLSASKKIWPCKGYWINENEKNRLRKKSIQAPFGYEFEPLNLDDAQLVDTTWPIRVEGLSLPMIKRQIEYFPNISLKSINRSKNRLISFELVEAELGIMSHLYTLPEFRRRGYAKLVEMKLIQLLIKENYVVVKGVLHGNEGGEKITENSDRMWEYFGDILWVRYGNEKMAAVYEKGDTTH